VLTVADNAQPKMQSKHWSLSQLIFLFIFFVGAILAPWVGPHFGMKVVPDDWWMSAGALAVVVFALLFGREWIKQEITQAYQAWQGVRKTEIAKRAASAGVSFEEARAAKVATSWALLGGAACGAGVLFVCYFLGLVPLGPASDPKAAGWSPLIWLLLIGGAFGAWLAVQLLKRKHPEALKFDPVSGASVLGLCWGGAIGAAAQALRNWVAYGTYNPEDTITAMVIAGVVGAMIGEWIGLARTGRKRTFRLVVSAVLSAGAGIVVLFQSMRVHFLLGFWQSVAATFPEAFADHDRAVRIFTVMGAALGLAVWAWWRFWPKVRGSSGNQPISGVLMRIVDDINDVLMRFKSAAIAVIKFTGASLVFWLVQTEPHAWTSTDVIFAGVGAGLCWWGIMDIRDALRRQPAMKNTGPYGDADLATEQQAADRERARGGEPIRGQF
jgi:uncharacterized membrane protein YsdA (DUF1294 family)